jgi:uncharacterized protein YjbJ (UPF0337 family)
LSVPAFFVPFSGTRFGKTTGEGGGMGLLDRLMGRGKQAAGDLTGDRKMEREGMHQEAEGEAESRAERHEERAMEEREQAAEHRVDRESM